MNCIVRVIQESDNRIIEHIIRNCLIEFKCTGKGSTWEDPNLSRFSEIYSTENSKYWIAEIDGKIVGGVGIAPLDGVPDVCELQKMYCIPEARGVGVSHSLIKIALDFAKKYYNRCYLETLKSMIAAQKFYEKYGFERIDKPLGNTGHYICDVLYIKNLR